MKNTLFNLIATLVLTSAALADNTPDHKVLVLKNKAGAAIGPMGHGARPGCAR